MSPAVTYPLSHSYWPSEGALTVYDESGQRLLTFPIRFLRLGLVQNYTYVIEQIQLCFEEAGFLVQPDGNRVPRDGVSLAGTLIYRREGK